MKKPVTLIPAFCLCVVLLTVAGSKSRETAADVAEPDQPAVIELAEKPAPAAARPRAVKRFPLALNDLPVPELQEEIPEPMPEPEPMSEPVPEPELDELEMLACVIYQEAGGDEASDKCRMMVGDVVLNRIADPRFPNTMEEVLTAPLQYGRWQWTGIVWPERANDPGEAAAVERAYDIARRLLSGEHSEIFEAGYVWQAEFEQGTDGFWLDGTYFGR